MATCKKRSCGRVCYYPVPPSWTVSVSLSLEAWLETKLQVCTVNVGGEARKHQQRELARRGEAANKGCIIKQVTTAGNWDQILLATLGASAEHEPHIIHPPPPARVAEVLIHRSPSVMG